MPHRSIPELEAQEGHKVNVRFIGILNCKRKFFVLTREGWAGAWTSSNCHVATAWEVRRVCTPSRPPYSFPLFFFFVQPRKLFPSLSHLHCHCDTVNYHSHYTLYKIKDTTLYWTTITIGASLYNHTRA